MIPLTVKNHIQMALSEDLGLGDITTDLVTPTNQSTIAFIKAKAEGVMSGLILLPEIFAIIDAQLEVKLLKNDGDKVKKGEILAELQGNASSILKGERVALNYLQYLSGIATKTAYITEIIKAYPARVVDTRKTIPGLRWLAKYAVRCGGGYNHRFNLSDGILIKDNHIQAAGGIVNAVQVAKKNAPHTLKVEVEVESSEGLLEAIEAGADIVMLDNMSPAEVKKAVTLASGRVLLEVSGGITEETILEYAKTGVDIISLGALTHSVKALDISLDLGKVKAPQL